MARSSPATRMGSVLAVKLFGWRKPRKIGGSPEKVGCFPVDRSSAEADRSGNAGKGVRLVQRDLAPQTTEGIPLSLGFEFFEGEVDLESEDGLLFRTKRNCVITPQK